MEIYDSWIYIQEKTCQPKEIVEPPMAKNYPKNVRN